MSTVSSHPIPARLPTQCMGLGQSQPVHALQVRLRLCYYRSFYQNNTQHIQVYTIRDKRDIRPLAALALVRGRCRNSPRGIRHAQLLATKLSGLAELGLHALTGSLERSSLLLSESSHLSIFLSLNVDQDARLWEMTLHYNGTAICSFSPSSSSDIHSDELRNHNNVVHCSSVLMFGSTPFFGRCFWLYIMVRFDLYNVRAKEQTSSLVYRSQMSVSSEVA